MVGRGVLDEILRYRVERAKHLLDSTELNMPTIAERCGFSSAERLTKVFAPRAGMSPSDYRRRTQVHR